ncbi:MAG: hypothetical protein ACRD0H_20100, partial [Actinomycetes bacterium]
GEHRRRPRRDRRAVRGGSPGVIPEEIGKQAQARLYTDVGAFFTNTSRGPAHCAVCTAPASSELCVQCASQQATYGTRLADLVVPLAYVRGWVNPPHQSEHHVRRYKHLTQPSSKCLQDLKLMMLASTLLHGECIASTVGSWWQVLTFVPSQTRPGPEHPVAELARQVAAHTLNVQRILLTLGPEFATAPERWPLPDRFVVAPEFVPVVVGRHVRVVDDTWVSGSKSQSAALALKAAGAAVVTIVCIGRWLSYRWEEHRPLIENLSAPYDAMQCPVTGGACPPAD